MLWEDSDSGSRLDDEMEIFLQIRHLIIFKIELCILRKQGENYFTFIAQM